MSNSRTATRVSGWWLSIGGALLAVALVFHGPPSPVIAEQMQFIADASLRWSTVHWIAAMAISSFAIAGLIALTSGGRLTATASTIAAWGMLTVGALWTMTTAVAEATTVASAAASGNVEMFEAWWVFSEGKANGFSALAVAIAVIATNKARSPGGVRPLWAAWIGAVAGVLSFLGWVAGSWLEIGFGGPVWLVSSLVMSLWLVWFGLSLVRDQSVLPASQATSAQPADSRQ